MWASASVSKNLGIRDDLQPFHFVPFECSIQIQLSILELHLHLVPSTGLYHHQIDCKISPSLTCLVDVASGVNRYPVLLGSHSQQTAVRFNGISAEQEFLTTLRGLLLATVANFRPAADYQSTSTISSNLRPFTKLNPIMLWTPGEFGVISTPNSPFPVLRFSRKPLELVEVGAMRDS
jgi:hypothetical protein